MIVNKISIRQNEQTFLDRLAAQRHLYSQAKTLSNILCFICILIPVGLAIVKVVFPAYTILPKLIVVYSFAATLIRIWLKDLTSKKKVLAARIQQLFDCELFSLEWNKALCGSIPQPEDVHSSSKGASYDKLNDWYEPIVSQLPPSVGSLVCMRTNVIYDQSLRKSYALLCYSITVLSMILVICFGLYKNTGMWDAFLYGIVPLMPLVTWGIDFYKQHNANMDALNNVYSLIDKGFNEASSDHSVAQKTLEEIQNFIFLHRKSSYFIPDLFYKALRNKNEENACYGAKEICKRYNLL